MKKRQKIKEKELKKLQGAKTFKDNVPKNEEPEVKVPIENEGENQNAQNSNDQNPNSLVVTAPDPTKSGGAIPPPPPPPPPPPVIRTDPENQKPPAVVIMNTQKDTIKNPYAQDTRNQNIEPALNPEMNNNKH